MPHYGRISGMIGRSAGRARRQRSSTTHATATASTPASRRLCRNPIGRRLCRLRRALQCEAKAGPITEAACWAHGRRNFFELADLRKAPLAIEAVRRIDAIFAIERELNGVATTDRRTARHDRVASLVSDLAKWMRAERTRLSRHAETAKAIDYMLKRWTAFIRRKAAAP